MGLSYLVYPGAHHTRFHHAIGCMHLMQKAVQMFRFKELKYLMKKKTHYTLQFYYMILAMDHFHTHGA